MSETEANRRISLTLSPAIELEALVLQQLQAIPLRRRQEWLRGLLLAGFVEQRRLLKEMKAGESDGIGQPVKERSTAPTGRSNFATWLTRSDRGKPEHTVVRRAANEPPDPKPVATVGKPFVRLSRVIGG